MECVVHKTVLRLMDSVLRERPKNAKEVLKVAIDVAKADIKGLGRGWWCGVCAAPNEDDAASCCSCRTGKNDPIPSDPYDGPLLSALQNELAQRAEALTAREAAVAAKEKELGIVAPGGTAGSGKTTAKANTTTPSRFGDGADLNPSQDKVPEIPKLLAKGYLPPKKISGQDGRGVLKHLATWYDPKNKKHWSETTIKDFCLDADFLVEYQCRLGKRGNEAAMCVRSLYAYTHSQLGPQHFWMMYAPEKSKGEDEPPIPPKYEPLTSTAVALEERFQADGAAGVTQLALTNEVLQILGPAEDEAGTYHAAALAGSFPKIGLTVYSLPSAHYLLRYENLHKGDKDYSPLRDTVSWLPRPEVLLRKTDTLVVDDAAESPLPLSGVFEFVAANPAERTTGSGNKGVWQCTMYADEELKQLREECTAQPNQQKANKKLHEKASALLNRTKTVPQADFPTITPELLRNVVTSASGMVPGALLTPEEIARAMTLQCLTFNGHHYLVTLSTTTVETRTPHTVGCIKTGEILQVYRSVACFWPQQIFYLLNMAMRESQFCNHEAELTVNETDLTIGQGSFGKFFASQPSSVDDMGETQKPEAPKFKKRDRGLFGTLHRVSAQWDERTSHWCIEYPSGKVERVPDGDTWLALKAWMLPQTRPLIFFMNKTLAAVNRQSDKTQIQKTYRGIRCALSREVYAMGNVLVWAQYSSTSEDQGVAAAFAKGEAPAAVFTMHGRDKCVLLSSYSRFAREAELLYMNNTCFRVSESLTTEQAQILGKENLQLFTLQEIEDIDMYCILIRRLLPLAKTTQAASVVFQAEAAMRNKKTLELSISSPADGEVPPKWQAFVTRLSAGCPIEGSSCWNPPKCSEELLSTVIGVHEGITSVDENETPHSALFLHKEPEGRNGTFGLTRLKLNSNIMAQAVGAYKREDNEYKFCIESNEDSYEITWDAGKWVFEYEDDTDQESIIFKSEKLLGDWPPVEKKQGPQIRSSHVKAENILVPRCAEGHALVYSKTAFRPVDCCECDKPLTGVHYVCSHCDYYVDPECVNVVTYTTNGTSVKLAIEENTLVKYVDEEVECPQLTSIEFFEEHIVDQRGFQTDFDAEHVLRLARLASLAHVPHNIPLTLESAIPYTDKPVFEIAEGLLGVDTEKYPISAVRVFGKVEGEDKICLRISGTAADNAKQLWVCDVELRRTDGRPGLAVGDDGATMAARIVRLGVPLVSVGLRNNLVTLDGAKKLLASVKQNNHVQEVTIDDDHTAEEDKDATLEVYKKALSLRCMYHRCVNMDQPLLEDHLSGMGKRWPEIFALSLGDLQNVKLPVAGILDQYPEGWKTMLARFKHPPEPTRLVMHTACRNGKVRAVAPLLDSCGVDPDEMDPKGNPAILLAVKQPAFECEVGGTAIKRLVTDPSSYVSQMAIRNAVRICGPIVTGALLDAGVEPDDHAEVLGLAVVNRLFGSRTTVLKRLITPAALKAFEHQPVLKASAVKDCSFSIIETLLDNGAEDGIEVCDEHGDYPLHMTCRHKYHNLGPAETRVAQAGAIYCDLDVMQRLVTQDTLAAENHNGELPITIAAKNCPYLCEFLIKNGSPVPEDPEQCVYLACQNAAFNVETALPALKTLFVKTKAKCEEGSNAGKKKKRKKAKSEASTTNASSTKDSDEDDDEDEDLDDDDSSTPHSAKGVGPCHALHHAAMKGFHVIVKFLMEDMAVDVTFQEDEEDTALHAAMRSGCDWGATPEHAELLKTMVKKQKDIDVKGSEDMTPLARAILSNQVHSASVLLELGAKVDVEISEMPLSFLVARSEFDASEQGMLLVRKVLNAENAKKVCDGVSALHFACWNGRVKMVEWLVSVGANPNVGIDEDDSSEGTPLSLAARCKTFGDHLDIFAKLITPLTINCGDDEEVPLYHAITKGNLKVIPLLLQNGALNSDKFLTEMCGSNDFDTPEGVELIQTLLTGASLNKKDEDDEYTLIYNAVCAGNIHICSLLLSKGCDILGATKDYKEENILTEVALESAFNTPEGRGIATLIVEKCPTLLNYPKSPPPHIEATTSGHVEITDAIIAAALPFKSTKQALDVHMYYEGGNFFHYHAAAEEFNNAAGVAVLEHALALSEDVGKTMKQIAGEEEEIRDATADKSANCLEHDCNVGATALTEACRAEHFAVVDAYLKIALERGGEDFVQELITIAPVNGATALHYLAKGKIGAPDNIMRQMATPAVVDLKTRRGLTPLHFAAKGTPTHTEVLLSCGADPNLADDEGNTPLHLAADAEVVALLVSHGAVATAKNTEGLQPLEYLLKKGYFSEEDYEVCIRGRVEIMGLIGEKSFKNIYI